MFKLCKRRTKKMGKRVAKHDTFHIDAVRRDIMIISDGKDSQR